MGQWDIHDFLKKNPDKWFTTKELSLHLGVSAGSIGSSVRKLRKTGLVETKTVKWTTEKRKSTRDVFAYRFKRG